MLPLLSVSAMIVSPTKLAAAGPPPLASLPMPLHRVRLHSDSFHGRAQALNTRYIKALDPDRLLYQFRLVAGLPTGSAVPYGGWISNGSLVAGHFTGHFISALSFTVASGDATVNATLTSLVNHLSACQAAYCAMHASTQNASDWRCGYLSAYDFSQIIALETQQGKTWATLTPCIRSWRGCWTHMCRPATRRPCPW